MNIHTMSSQLRLIVRGELLVIQAKLAFAVRRGGFIALAVLFAGLGLVFINMGLFAWLSPLWGPVWTPAGLGLINLGLAVGALGISTMIKPGPEMALAEEIRTMASSAFESEIRTAPLMGGLGGIDRSALTGLLLPALSSIIGALAKRRKPAEKA